MVKSANNITTLLTDAKRTSFKYVETPEPKIRWSEWLSRPTVELWEGVALSLGVNPANKVPLDTPGELNGDQFYPRLNLSIEHLRPGGLLREIEKNDRKHFTRVSLTDLSKLAKAVNWTVPNEFPKPGDKEPGAEKAHQNEIIRRIIEKGLDPLALMDPKGGLAGTKAAIRKDIEASRPLVMTDSCFRKAWQALLDSKRIIRIPYADK